MFELLVAHFGTSALVPGDLYSFLLFSTMPMAAPSSNKMETPDPDWDFLQPNLPINQVDWDLVKTYLFDRFTTPPTEFIHRQGQTIIPDVHPNRICEHIMHFRPCPSFTDPAYRCPGYHPEFLLQGPDVIWTPAGPGVAVHSSAAPTSRTKTIVIDLSANNSIALAGPTLNSWPSEAGPWPFTVTTGSPFTAASPTSTARHLCTSRTTRTSNIALPTRPTCPTRTSSSIPGKKPWSHPWRTSWTHHLTSNHSQPTTTTTTESNNDESNARGVKLPADLVQSMLPQNPLRPRPLPTCAAQHSTAIDHSPRIPTVRTGHTTSISPTNRLRPHQAHIILPVTGCHTECHTDFVHTTDASPEHTEPMSHQRSTLHSSGPSVSIVHHTMATNVHSGDRPMGRTRFRRPSCPCSQPPRHSSSQFGTIPGPPDQPSGIPLQFLHTAYPEGILPRLHQLPVLRQRPIRPIRQLADPHPTSGWHLCSAPSELQRRRILQHNDVVGTLVPTNLTPPRPTGVHRTDTHDSTPHQHRRPRDCHSDQLLLYQDEPRTSIGFPDQPQQSRRDLSDLPERMAEFRRRSISAFPQPKRHFCQIQLQRGLRDLRSPQCQHSGTPKGVGRQRPEHPG